MSDDMEFWTKLTNAENILHKLLFEKPMHLKRGYQKSPDGIINAYVKGDISYETAIKEFEELINKRSTAFDPRIKDEKPVAEEEGVPTHFDVEDITALLKRLGDYLKVATPKQEEILVQVVEEFAERERKRILKEVEDDINTIIQKRS